jgi:hypothetical protein
MKIEEVAEILSCLGIRNDPGNGSITIAHYDGSLSLKPNGKGWTLERVRDGEILAGPACTKRDLQRALLEWMAGPKPPGARYASRRKNRFGDHVIWVS